MTNNIEEFLLILNGETMALNLLVKALIATHPNPAALSKEIQIMRQQAAKANSEKPSPNLQLFRFEQVLDQQTALIQLPPKKHEN